MVRVIDIWDESKNIVGNMSDEFLLRRLTSAVELLAQKGDFDPQLGTIHLRTCGRIVTLPPDIETILACNICGFPAVSRDELFSFHINGPGAAWGKQGAEAWGIDGVEIRYEWMDLNDFPTYQDICTPDTLIAYCVEAADVNCNLWVFGLDNNGNEVMTQLSDGTFKRGYKVPVFQSVGATPANAPIFSKITGVQKQLTAGPIKLTTTGQILLGVYQPTETLPRYRRIKLSKGVPYVTLKYRRRTANVTSKYDIIAVSTGQAVLMMLRALKAYEKPETISEGEAYESTAVRWLTEKQKTSNPPVVQPLQVIGAASLLEPFEYMD